MSCVKKIDVETFLGPIEDEVDFFFSNFFGSVYPSIYREDVYWKPPTDVYETSHDYFVIMELGHMKPEDVSITFNDGILTIQGVRKAVPSSEQRKYHKMEINYGPFVRRIPIRDEVDIESLSAKYHDGFLEIRLPKREISHNNIIDIEIE